MEVEEKQGESRQVKQTMLSNLRPTRSRHSGHRAATSDALGFKRNKALTSTPAYPSNVMGLASSTEPRT